MAEVEIRRSRRRTRTVQVRREGAKTIALVPAHLSSEQADEIVARLVARLEKRERRLAGDTDLMARAARLSSRYLDGRAEPESVRWVSNQNTRWGSCTIGERTIRLSDRLIGMPDWVVDYVIVHELAHLLEANHSARFWELVSAYPHAERAKGFLEGVSHQQR